MDGHTVRDARIETEGFSSLVNRLERGKDSGKSGTRCSPYRCGGSQIPWRPLQPVSTTPLEVLALGRRSSQNLQGKTAA